MLGIEREDSRELLHMGNVQSGTADKIRLECPEQFSGRKKNWSTAKTKLFQKVHAGGGTDVLLGKGGVGFQWGCAQCVPKGGDMGQRGLGSAGTAGGQQGDRVAFPRVNL